MKARLGDWECNLREWRMGKGMTVCWGCEAWYADLAHYVLKCREFRQGRNRVAGMLKEIWGNERWEQWAGMSEELQVAEWLGLRGGCSDRQKGAICWNSWWRSTERGVGGSRCKFQDRE